MAGESPGVFCNGLAAAGIMSGKKRHQPPDRYPGKYGTRCNQRELQLLGEGVGKLCSWGRGGHGNGRVRLFPNEKPGAGRSSRGYLAARGSLHSPSRYQAGALPEPENSGSAAYFPAVPETCNLVSFLHLLFLLIDQRLNKQIVIQFI